SIELGSAQKLKALMARGGHSLFTGNRPASRFGEQTGGVHGGLCFSRSSTQFWREAPGMLRDVDMAGCYNSIIAQLNVYWGKPLVFEPGRRALSLSDAIELVAQHAEPDAWYVRVTGDISNGFNVLIPSTVDAVTSENFGKKRRASPQIGS